MNYDWGEFRNRNCRDRYSDNVRGAAAWKQQGAQQRLDLRKLAADVIDTRKQFSTGPSRLCIFVSHKQADAARATRIAYLPCQEGFWLTTPRGAVVWWHHDAAVGSRREPSYDTADVVALAREIGVTPHIEQNDAVGARSMPARRAMLVSAARASGWPRRRRAEWSA